MNLNRTAPSSLRSNLAMSDSDALGGEERDPLAQYTSSFTSDRILVRSSLPSSFPPYTDTHAVFAPLPLARFW